MYIKHECTSPVTTRLGNIRFGCCFHAPGCPRTIYILLDTSCGGGVQDLGDEKVYVASTINGNIRTMAISRQVVSLPDVILLPHGEES